MAEKTVTQFPRNPRVLPGAERAWSALQTQMERAIVATFRTNGFPLSRAERASIRDVCITASHRCVRAKDY